MTDPERAAALESIAQEVRVCTRCRLHERRHLAVPGEGSADTEVVFVGEGPGRDENQAGRPFVGASGRLLGELIGSLGWRREDVYITNVVKCWPPGNRDPQADEIAACAPFLRRQLEVLDPAVVVTVGKHSLGSFMPGERIGRVHGTARPADPETGARDALVFAMYHPAFALYDGSNRTTLETDMAALPATLLAARRRRGELAPDTAADPRPDRGSPTQAPGEGPGDRLGDGPREPAEASEPAGSRESTAATRGTAVRPAVDTLSEPPVTAPASAPARPADDADADQLTLF